MSIGLIRNREGSADFNVRWPWTSGHLQPGLTAVLRLKDEARNLPWVLPPLMRAVDQIVLVDNQSTDGTVDLARQIAEREGAAGRLHITEYPFDVSRCGPEHLETPGDSVHSLTHFYNWSFSQAQTQYSMKWDGDMVLTPEGAALVADVGWQIATEETIVVFQHHPLYVESPQVAYFDIKLRNMEPWIYPQGPDYTYIKGFDWEIRAFPDDVRRMTMPQGLCFELKWLDMDEFAHWSTPEAFDPVRSPRKVREYEVFTALVEGRSGDVDCLHRIVAPEGVHVVDHVAQTWLPRMPRPLST
ncbi:MAG: glycosyltransferase family 2 protein [Nocardioidaceae bacterium]|nr:glycosyltransferase family 2 protein [Nocardioidaceae bacterium]